MGHIRFILVSSIERTHKARVLLELERIYWGHISNPRARPVFALAVGASDRILYIAVAVPPTFEGEISSRVIKRTHTAADYIIKQHGLDLPVIVKQNCVGTHMDYTTSLTI